MVAPNAAPAVIPTMLAALLPDRLPGHDGDHLASLDMVDGFEARAGMANFRFDLLEALAVRKLILNQVAELR